MSSTSGSSIDLGLLPDMTTIAAQKSACGSSSTTVSTVSSMPNCIAAGEWSTAGPSSASDGSTCVTESLPSAEAAGSFRRACSDRIHADPVPTFEPAAAAMAAAADGNSSTPGGGTAAVSAASAVATVARHALPDSAGARKATGSEAAVGRNGAPGVVEKTWSAGATETTVAAAAAAATEIAANTFGESVRVNSGAAMATSAAAAAAETTVAAAAGPSAEGRSALLPFGFADTLSALAAVEAAVAAAAAAVAATERGGPSAGSPARTLSAASPTPSFAGSEANSEASTHRRSLGRPNSRTGARRPPSAAGSAASNSSDWEDKVRLNLEYIAREKQRKIDEMMEAQRQAEEHRQRQEEHRRQRIEEVKRKEEERQRLVEERRLAREHEKKEQWTAAQEKKSKQIGRPLEDMTTKHGRYEAFGFGSCTRRFDDILLIDPGRRSASISNLSARQLAEGGGECAEGFPSASVGDGCCSVPLPPSAAGPSMAVGTSQQPPLQSHLSLGLSPARGQLAKPMSLSAVNLSVSGGGISRAAPHRRAATLSPTAEVVSETSAETAGDALQSTSAASGYVSRCGQQPQRRANPPSCASIMTHSALLKVAARSQPSLLLLNTSPVDRLSPAVGHGPRHLGPARTAATSRLSVHAEEGSHAAAAAAGTAHTAAFLHAGTAVLQDPASAAYAEAEASKRRAKSTDSGVRQQGHARHSPGHLSLTAGSPAAQADSKGAAAKSAGSGGQKTSLSNATTPVAAYGARKGPASTYASSPIASAGAVPSAARGRPPSLDRGSSAPAPSAAATAVPPASHGVAVMQSPPSMAVIDALANSHGDDSSRTAEDKLGHEQNVASQSLNESAGSGRVSGEQHAIASREKSIKAQASATSKPHGGMPSAKDLHGRSTSGSVTITTMRKAVSVSVLTHKTVHGSSLPSSKATAHVAATSSSTVKRSSVDAPGAVDLRGKVSGPQSASIRATGTTEPLTRSDTTTTTSASKANRGVMEAEASHSEVLDHTASVAAMNHSTSSSSSSSNIPSGNSSVHGAGEATSVTTHVPFTQPSDVGVHPSASEDDHESVEGTYKSKLAEKRRQARDKAEKEAEALRLKQEELRREAEEKLRREAEEQRRFEEEESRLAEEAHQAEEERLRRAIAEAEARRSAELAAAEAERRAKEEQDQKAKEESEKRERALREKIEKEEIERQERRKKLEAIMRRVKPADSPGQEAKKATSSGRSSPESRLLTESSYTANSAAAAVTSDVPSLSGLTADTSLSLDSAVVVHHTTPAAVSSIQSTEPTRDDADSLLEYAPSGGLSSPSFSSSSATSSSFSSSHLSGSLSSPRSLGQGQTADVAPEQLPECRSELLPLPSAAAVVHGTDDAASSSSCRPAGTLLPGSSEAADSSSPTSVHADSASVGAPADAAPLHNGSCDASSSGDSRWLTSRQSPDDSNGSSSCRESSGSVTADGLLTKQGTLSGSDQHLTNGSSSSPDNANSPVLIAF